MWARQLLGEATWVFRQLACTLNGHPKWGYRSLPRTWLLACPRCGKILTG